MFLYVAMFFSLMAAPHASFVGMKVIIFSDCTCVDLPSLRKKVLFNNKSNKKMQ